MSEPSEAFRFRMRPREVGPFPAHRRGGGPRTEAATLKGLRALGGGSKGKWGKGTAVKRRKDKKMSAGR